MSNVKVKAPKKPVKPVIVVIYILLVILAVIYLAPLLWMLSVSLKDNAGVMSAPFSLPEVFHFENGFVEIPEGPGLGVEVDEEIVQEQNKNRHNWKNPMWRTYDGTPIEW